jgi:Flp pilus assembly protein TadG
MRRPRKNARSRSGAALLEGAVCLNVLLIMMAGIMEHGRLIMTRQVMNFAANEGARQAIVHASTWSTADVQAAVQAYINQIPVTSTSISVTQTDSNGNDVAAPWTSASFGKGIAVSIDANYSRLTALSGLVGVPSPLRLRSRSIARSEAN